MKIHECHHEVRQEDDQRKSIVQQILQKSTDFLRRTIAPVPNVCPYVCIVSQLKTQSGGFLTRHGKKQCNWWCAACGGQHNWRHPNRILVVQDSTDPQRSPPPNGACENLVSNHQLGGDRPVQLPV